METSLVCGGGIAGLVAAKVLASKGAKVMLVEREPCLGGLLQSKRHGDFTYDMGTHLLRDTPSLVANRYVFSSIKDSREWQTLGNLSAGHFALGKPYFDSASIDIRSLSPAKYKRAVSELLELESAEILHLSAKDYLLSKFGLTLYNEIFEPQLRKYFGQSPESLHYLAAQFIGLNRVIAFDVTESAEIKKRPGLDSRLAYNHFSQGESVYKNYYPIKCGVGIWIDALERELEGLGVTIRKCSSVDSVAFDNGNITEAVVSGETIKVSQLVWSLPPSILAGLLGISVGSLRPETINVYLNNFEFRDPFLTKNIYFHCYDDRMLSFRVTLYSNLRLSEKPRLTVEILTAEELNEKTCSQIVLKELIEMGIVSHSNPMQQSFLVRLPKMPILTNEFVEQNKTTSKALLESVNNLSLVGKARGDLFFMNDVIVDTVENFH